MQVPFKFGTSKIIAAWFMLAIAGLFYESCRPQKPIATPPAGSMVKANEILTTAKQLMGSPYAVAGTTPGGFDCSGYTAYVFKQHGITIPHSSKEQMKQGIAVALCDAVKGDLIIFTGTNASVREAGHVGIVLENNNCVITFIHASSSKKESGVKLNTTEDGYYQARFLGVRRVLW